ncbi:hypothetical protein, partial [Ferrimicrobium acidiphilum]|uniref:hypothetical protein n=1 Tax=Ferrimicrobium acidiphilum TaxID=121039 RepID=UPI0023F248B4
LQIFGQQIRFPAVVCVDAKRAGRGFGTLKSSTIEMAACNARLPGRDGYEMTQRKGMTPTTPPGIVL